MKRLWRRISDWLGRVDGLLVGRGEMPGSIVRYEELLGPLYKRNRTPATSAIARVGHADSGIIR